MRSMGGLFRTDTTFESRQAENRRGMCIRNQFQGRFDQHIRLLVAGEIEEPFRRSHDPFGLIDSGNDPVGEFQSRRQHIQMGLLLHRQRILAFERLQALSHQLFSFLQKGRRQKMVVRRYVKISLIHIPAFGPQIGCQIGCAQIRLSGIPLCREN